MVDFLGAYHALLGRPCYVKFMAVPNHTYLKLMMSGPKGVITVSTSLQRVYQRETENGELAAATVSSTEELATRRWHVVEDTPEASHKNVSFEPTEGTKEVQINPEVDKGKTVRVGTPLTPK